MTRIYLSPPHVGPDERRLLLEAFDSNWIAPLGPHVDAFEAELGSALNIQNVVALSSGTAALHLALLVLGVGRGDKVLVSDLTFAATVNAIAYLGAEPVFIDSEAASWNMDPQLLAEEIEDLAERGEIPKAVVVVDLYGQCADYDRIQAICDRHGIPIIEDAAEALGASHRGRSAGTFGVVGVLSFNGNKIITTSGGGALTTENRAFADRVRFLATQARDPAPHYQHSTIGYNYRLSNLLAAVGRGQLRHLPERVAARRRTFETYRGAFRDLPGITFAPEAPWGVSNRWLTCITVDPAQFGASREDIRRALEGHDIESRPLWKPMHLQPVFERCRVRGGVVSEELFEKGLCLPSGSALTSADLERICGIVRESCRTVNVSKT